MQQRSTEFLKVSLYDIMASFKMVFSFRHFYGRIRFIQKRLKDKVEAKVGKVEVLVNYWDKLFG